MSTLAPGRCSPAHDQALSPALAQTLNPNPPAVRRFQLERLGYLRYDPDSRPGALVAQQDGHAEGVLPAVQQLSGCIAFSQKRILMHRSISAAKLCWSRPPTMGPHFVNISKSAVFALCSVSSRRRFPYYCRRSNCRCIPVLSTQCASRLSTAKVGMTSCAALFLLPPPTTPRTRGWQASAQPWGRPHPAQNRTCFSDAN